jgi:hypothetical protein
MSANSKIEWTDHTFNPWIGCTKVSPGCAHCYVAHCKAAAIPVFVKQLGAVPTRNGLYFPPDMIRDRKGGNPAEWPQDLRIREMLEPQLSI